MELMLQWVSNHFTIKHYLTATKMLGMLWSIADIVLVYYFLKIAELSTTNTSNGKIKYRYWLLWLSAVLTPFLLFAQTKNQYFILDSIVCGLQYLILLYTLIFSGKTMMRYILNIINPAAAKALDADAKTP